MIARRTLLAVAIAAGLIAALAYWFDARRVAVLVAARTLAAERVVLAEDLGTLQLPLDAVPSDALVDPGEAVGRTIHTRLDAGQFVLRGAFAAPPGFRAGVAPPLGWHAVALPVSPAVALGGAIAPGMRVDVIAVPVSGRAPADRAPERIASGVLVLDVRSEAGGPFSEPGSEKAGVFANAQLGSVIVAVPAADDVRLAERIATSTFILFRSP
jgi:pilus assembly protein CpaB